MQRIQLAPFPELVFLGTYYGGWSVPDKLIDSSWLCYSFGAGGDVSFDLELMRRYGMRVRSIEPVEGYLREAERDAAGDPRFSAHRAALAVGDGPIRMQLTHDRTSRSVSAAQLYDSSDYVELPGRSLRSLMAELGDERVDLLKLDIEGSEYEVLPTIDLAAAGVRVLGVELHHTGTVRQARGLIANLERQGYRPVASEPVLKLTFVRSDS